MPASVMASPHRARALIAPADMRIAPPLPVMDPTRPLRHYALLVNPFYPKDPRASFGKHVLTPTLALTSIAGATPDQLAGALLGRESAAGAAAQRAVCRRWSGSPST